MDLDVAAVGSEVETFLDGLMAWAALALPNFVGAILILLFGWWLAGRAGRLVAALMDRQTRVDATVRSVVASVVRYGVLVLVAVAVLGQLGVQTTSIIAALGAAGLAIGLALQGTLSNIAAGIMLLWLRPFRLGDYIDTGSAAGTVKEVGLFNCELHSWDGIYQFVPNSEVWNRKIINYSRLPTRLVDLKFGVSYDDDLARGREVLLAVAARDPRTLQDPPPVAFVDDLGDSAVVLCLRVWAANADYWELRRWLTEAGKLALEEAGLSIPFPQRDLHLRGGDGAAAVRLLQGGESPAESA